MCNNVKVTYNIYKSKPGLARCHLSIKSGHSSNVLRTRHTWKKRWLPSTKVVKPVATTTQELVQLMGAGQLATFPCLSVNIK